MKKLTVFLCHSSADKKKVREIKSQLQKYDFDFWIDEDRLIPGQDWNSAIELTLSTTDVIIVFLSKNSITKVGYVQKEIKIALDYVDYQPEDGIFLIPVKLEECEIPFRLKRFQYLEINNENWEKKLKDALDYVAKKLNKENTKKEISNSIELEITYDLNQLFDLSRNEKILLITERAESGEGENNVYKDTKVLLEKLSPKLQNKYRLFVGNLNTGVYLSFFIKSRLGRQLADIGLNQSGAFIIENGRIVRKCNWGYFEDEDKKIEKLRDVI